ncbi:MAG TPA: GMP synthase (glutamine-hydrolyzing), partial [Cupriavidus sp.]|nr:GMP synthase (glutamine-hydrolyzing) [Cupriavidus sp.]
MREAGAFSILVAPDVTIEHLKSLEPAGIILSGGPASIDEVGAPRCDPAVLDMGIPVLGICYGMQLGCHMLGATIERAEAREYGRAKLSIHRAAGLFEHLPNDMTAWMSHGDQVSSLS